ncbi:MAG: hypothetical protein K2X77_24740 [Candidatus Obscuribacterales bacterium]|jgi:hypothetical protein|nr:hypothetical protein [Candidatus Obscuribacterales bacterium]
MSQVTCDRGAAKRFADDVIAQFKSQKIPGNPRVCVNLPDYPSDEIMSAALDYMKAEGYIGEPVEFTATDGRAGCIWVWEA